MTQTLPKLVTFEQFMEWYPSNGTRYELHKGVVVEMPPPTGEHENVIGFLAAQITFQFLKMGLPFRIPKTAFVKIESNNSTYSPDILLLNHDNLANEPLWSKQSTVIQSASIPLAVEVISTNWRDAQLLLRRGDGCQCLLRPTATVAKEVTTTCRRAPKAS